MKEKEIKENYSDSNSQQCQINPGAGDVMSRNQNKATNLQAKTQS